MLKRRIIWYYGMQDNWGQLYFKSMVDVTPQIKFGVVNMEHMAQEIRI